MMEPRHLTNRTDHDLLDVRGHEIAVVRAVRYDEVTGSPKWAVSKTGFFGTNRLLVSAAQILSSGYEHMVCPMRGRVASPPRVQLEAIMCEPDDRRYDFYGKASRHHQFWA